MGGIVGIRTLTMQIKRLEQEIGFYLFERTSRSIKLTPSGTMFLDTARQLLTVAQQGRNRAQRAAIGEAGRLVLGYIPAAEFHVFRKVIPGFSERFPDLHLSFRMLFGVQQMSALRLKEIDVSFVWLPVMGDDDLLVEPLVDDAPLLCLPISHPLTRKRVVGMKDLHNEKLIMFPRDGNPMFYRQIEDLFAEGGATMHVVHEIEHPLSTINFVAMGYGLGVVPGYIIHQVNLKGVAFRPFEAMSKTLAALCRKENNPAAQTFVKYMTETMRNPDNTG